MSAAYAAIVSRLDKIEALLLTIAGELGIKHPATGAIPRSPRSPTPLPPTERAVGFRIDSPMWLRAQADSEADAPGQDESRDPARARPVRRLAPQMRRSSPEARSEARRCSPCSKMGSGTPRMSGCRITRIPAIKERGLSHASLLPEAARWFRRTIAEGVG